MPLEADAEDAGFAWAPGAAAEDEQAASSRPHAATAVAETAARTAVAVRAVAGRRLVQVMSGVSSVRRSDDGLAGVVRRRRPMTEPHPGGRLRGKGWEFPGRPGPCGAPGTPVV